LVLFAHLLLVVATAAAVLLTPKTPASADPSPEAALVGVTQVDVGRFHSCARLRTGQVRCWGDNDSRELGDGTLAESNQPVTTVNPAGSGPMTGVTQVDAGGFHSCARLRTGQARCWGSNFQGELGTGDGAIHVRPVTVLNGAGNGPLLAVTGITTGTQFTCARFRNRQARCWGANGAGQLGTGSFGGSLSLPATVRGLDGPGPLTGVLAVSAGSGTACARLTGGRAACWGSNADGRLGSGIPGDSAIPRLVSNPTGTGPLTGVAQVVVGSRHACARLTSGQVRCWGANDDGQLGTGANDPSNRPVGVKGTGSALTLTGVTRLTAGFDHTCARLTSGQVRCWGQNFYAQLGDRSTSHRNRPVAVRNASGSAALTGVTDLSGGERHTCFRTTTEVLCTGDNAFGQLGDGTFADSDRPVGVRR
jgi:alpha-tubulin suppressor-like RCC1 family protein